MELAAGHPSGIWVFEIGPRIFGKCADLSHDTNIYMPSFHTEQSVKATFCLVLSSLWLCIVMLKICAVCNFVYFFKKKKSDNEFGISHY